MILYVSHDSSKKYKCLHEFSKDIKHVIPDSNVYNTDLSLCDFIILDNDLSFADKVSFSTYFNLQSLCVSVISYYFNDTSLYDLFKSGVSIAISDYRGAEEFSEIYEAIKKDEYCQYLIVNQFDNKNMLLNKINKKWFTHSNDIMSSTCFSKKIGDKIIFSDSCTNASNDIFIWYLNIKDYKNNKSLWYFSSKKLKKFLDTKDSLDSLESFEEPFYKCLKDNGLSIYHIRKSDNKLCCKIFGNFIDGYIYDKIDDQILSFEDKGENNLYIDNNVEIIFTSKCLGMCFKSERENIKLIIKDEMEHLVTSPFRIIEKLTDQQCFESSATFITVLFKDIEKYNGAHKYYVSDSDINSVTRVAEDMELVVNKVSDDLRLAYYTRIVSHEYLLNASIHGENLTVTVSELKSANGKVLLTFWDMGYEWVPEEGGALTWNDPDDIYAPGGRGLKIIDSLSTFFQRKRIGSINETIIYLPRNDI